MLYLEAHKFFKRKLVIGLLIGIFLLTAVLEILGVLYHVADYEGLQQKINIYEKYNGTFTESTAEQFLIDYEENFPDKEMDYFYESAHLENLVDTLPDISFDIRFGFYEEWQMLLTNLIMYVQYIPVFVAVAFSGIFTYDKVCGMQEIMLSSINGRRESAKAKALLAFLVTNGMFLLMILLTWLRMFLFTQGRGWNSSIQMAIWLVDSPLDMSFGVLWLHTLLLSFLAINTILLVTLSASFLAQSPVAAMCVSLAVLFLLRPDAIEIYLGEVETLNKMISLTPYNIINTYKLAERTPLQLGGAAMDWIYIVEILYTLLLLIGGMLFFKKLIKRQKYFAS